MTSPQIKWQNEGTTDHIVVRCDRNRETGEFFLKSASDPSFPTQTYKNPDDLGAALASMAKQDSSSS